VASAHLTTLCLFLCNLSQDVGCGLLYKRRQNIFSIGLCLAFKRILQLRLWLSRGIELIVNCDVIFGLDLTVELGKLTHGLLLRCHCGSLRRGLASSHRGHAMGHHSHRRHVGGHAAGLHEFSEAAAAVLDRHSRHQYVVALFLLRLRLKLNGDSGIKRCDFNRRPSHHEDHRVADWGGVVRLRIIALAKLSLRRGNSDTNSSRRFWPERLRQRNTLRSHYPTSPPCPAACPTRSPSATSLRFDRPSAQPYSGIVSLRTCPRSRARTVVRMASSPQEFAEWPRRTVRHLISPHGIQLVRRRGRISACPSKFLWR